MQKKLNEDFIEKYSELFASKISKDFFTSNAHISGQEILNISPSKQVNFFVIKLLFNNWQQESQRLESPFFNYGAGEVKEALLQFMNVLSRHIQVGRKEFEILLQDAVRDTLFLMMSPNVYMEIEMDRKGAEELTQKTVKSILKYIKIAKPDFESYLSSNVGTDRDDIEIDESIITDEMLEAEIALLNEVIPITRAKLEEGDDDDEEGEEEVAPPEQDEEEDLLNVSEDDLHSATVARASVKETTEKEPEDESPEPEEVTEETIDSDQGGPEVEDEAPSEPETEADPDSPEETLEETEPTEESDPMTFDDEEEEELTSPPVIEEISDPSIITNMAPGEEEEGEDDDILNDKFEDPLTVPSIAESHADQVDDMMSAISVNHRYMFINELFDGEADVFTEAISKIEKCSSFDDSVEILVQNYAKDYHWDMNSDEVKELLKIIFRRFR